jgi:hypothetical protein
MRSLKARVNKLLEKHKAAEEQEAQQSVVKVWTDTGLARYLAKSGQAPLNIEADAKTWPRTIGTPPGLWVVYRIDDGYPDGAEIDRLLKGKVRGGVMLVPVFGDGSLEDWEAGAIESQRRLKAEVRQ